MNILIKGVEMPIDGMIGVFISSDGNVYDSMDDIIGTIVPVPPHGRLIDADAEITVWDMGYDGAPHIVKTTVSRFILGHLNGAIPPTVIEAEVDDG